MIKREEVYIYKITNLINNKIYIGITSKNINSRFKKHIDNSKQSKPKTRISKAIKKYGEINFKIELLEIVENLQIGLKRELDLIKLYQSESKSIGYNVFGAKQYGSGMKGKKHTKNTRLLMSQTHKKRIPHPNSLKNLKPIVKGQKFFRESMTYGRKIIDDLGQIYISITQASIILNLKKSNICAVLKGKRKKTGGRSFQYVN